MMKQRSLRTAVNVSNSYRLIQGAIACVLGATSSGAFAQSSGSLEEIVVTAQRREESLQDVPIAVTAMNAEQLESLGLTSLNDLADAAVPGLTVLPFAGATGTLSFNMRGVSTPDPTSGLADPGVAVYTDGIVIGRSYGNGLELVDAQRVEILRGPQGTLFGRNAEGGAIQYVSKRPTGEFGGRAQASFGNFDAQRYQAMLDLPAFANVAVKLGGLISKHDGYTKNRELGPADSLSKHEDFGIEDMKAIRVAAEWKPTDVFSAYYIFDVSRSDPTNYFTYRTGGRTPTEPGFCSVPATQAFCATPASIAANLYTGTQQPQDGRIGTSPVPLYEGRNQEDTEGHALILQWDASDTLTFKSLTGYRDLVAVQDNNLGTAIAFVQFVPTSLLDGGAPDVPAGTLSAVGGSYAHAQVKQHQLSQEFQLIGSMERFRYTAGLYYFKEEMTDLRDSFFTLVYPFNPSQPGVLSPVSVDAFPLRTNPSGSSTSLQVYDAEARSYAAYAQGTYTPAILGDRLDVTIGLRYTNDKKEHVRTVFAGLDDSTVAPDFKSDRVDPAVTLAYRVNDGLNTYLRYASAYRGGGVWIRNKAPLTTYDEEKVKSLEFGWKADFSDQVRWNAATYYSEVTGYQASVQNLPFDPSSTDIASVGKIKFWGWENELVWAPTTSVLTSLTYTYQDADAPSQVPAPLPRGGVVSFQTPALPKHQASARIDWNIPLGGMQLTPHVDYSYQSKFALSPAILQFTNPAPSRVDSLNARLSLQGLFGQEGLTVALWGRNLTKSDELVFTFPAPTSDFTVSPAGGAGYMVPPRTYGVEMKYEF